MKRLPTSHMFDFGRCLCTDFHPMLIGPSHKSCNPPMHERCFHTWSLGRSAIAGHAVDADISMQSLSQLSVALAQCWNGQARKLCWPANPNVMAASVSATFTRYGSASAAEARAGPGWLLPTGTVACLCSAMLAKPQGYQLHVWLEEVRRCNGRSPQVCTASAHGIRQPQLPCCG